MGTTETLPDVLESSRADRQAQETPRRPVSRHRPPGGARITFVGDFTGNDGRTNEYLARGMHHAGARLSVAPLTPDLDGRSSELRRLVAESSATVDGPVLYSGALGRPEFRCLPGTDLFAYTTCESSRIPSRWAAHLDRTRAVITPTRFAANVFRTSGVTAPIYVVPDGVDPETYRYQERFGNKGLTTLMLRPTEPHTNTDQGIAAWQAAFRDDPDARLIIKAWQGWPSCHLAADPRIHVDTLKGPYRRAARWYAEADVLLAPDNENSGTMLLEAMASGLPVIALDSEGQSDICREAGELVLPIEPVTWRPFLDPEDGECHGVTGVPGSRDIATALRWVADHRGEAAELGRKASTWVREHRDIRDCGADVLAVIAEHTRTRRAVHHARSSAPARPLRPTAAAAPPAAPALTTTVRDGRPPLWSFQPDQRASLGVVTLWDPNIDAWARQHAEDKRAYCERHGFAFYGYTDVFTTDRAPHWSKIPAVQQHLADHDWVFWTDADAAITNFDFDLRDFCDDEYDLVVTHDELGLNSGSMLIRNTEAARHFLRRAWIQDVSDLFYEQAAMARAIALLPQLRVKVLEKRSMNSFWNEHRRGDFIMHAAGQPTAAKIPLLEAFRAHACGRPSSTAR